MPACSAFGCKQRRHENGITLHRFPKDPIQRQKWIVAVRRKDFVPSSSAVLCSKHFKEEDIDRTSLSVVRIRDNAVPSVFDAFPEYLKKKQKHRKPPKVRHITDSLTVIVESSASAANATSSTSAADRSVHNSAEHIPIAWALREAEVKRKLDFSQTQLQSSRKKIKLLQQSVRRLLHRNATLSAVITDLRKRKLQSTDSLHVLDSCASGVSDLLKREISKKTGETLPVKYSPELRSFAKTLHQISPHAYNYVRKMFDTCLPHPRTIKKWFQNVDAKLENNTPPEIMCKKVLTEQTDSCKTSAVPESDSVPVKPDSGSFNKSDSGSDENCRNTPPEIMCEKVLTEQTDSCKTSAVPESDSVPVKPDSGSFNKSDSGSDENCRI